jgi:hypothetical protein
MAIYAHPERCKTAKNPTGHATDVPPDEEDRHDHVLTWVKYEVIWLGEEYVLPIASWNFNFDTIYDFASPTT